MGRRSPIVRIKNNRDHRILLDIIRASRNRGDYELNLEGFKKTEDGKIWALIDTYERGLELLAHFKVYSIQMMKLGDTNMDYSSSLDRSYPNWDELKIYRTYEDAKNEKNFEMTNL